MFRQCEDDPDFIARYMGMEATCSMVMGYMGSCEADRGAVDDNTGVAASEACPISCGTGCALTFDSCWNSPCQNGGGECVNLPGVEAFGCTCPAGFCTENCAAPDTLDHSDGNPNCPVRPEDPQWVMINCLSHIIS